MAGANLPAKKYKKTSPTVTRLSFEFTGSGTQFIDIAKALSAINRRFYRQGVYYYVNSVEVYNNEAGIVDLHTCPDNWITKNAHSRGFKLYQKMNSLVDSVSGVGRPKYHDFKVYMSALHYSTGTASPVLHGINSQATTMNSDDWVYSVFTSADDDQDGASNADEFNVHIIGGHSGSSDNWNTVGLIKSYGESRNTISFDTPEDGNIVNTDPMMNIFDFSSEEQMNDIVENLQNDNDNPPYDFNLYVGESNNDMQHVARIGTETGINRIARASGFCAPFGLICVDPQEISTAYRLVLNLAVGTYHGVYAERV